MAEPAVLALPPPADLAACRDYLLRLVRVAYVYAHIEPTNACNLACSVCPREAMRRPPRLMSWSLFEAAMDRILPSPVPMLAFVGFGEPTLHKGLARMIAHARARRPELIVKVTTNGSRLTPAAVAALYDAGLDLLEISAMGGSPAEYEHAMGQPFAALVALVARLNAERRAYALATFPMPGADPSAVRRFWESTGAASVEMKGLHRRGGRAALGPVPAAAAVGGYAARVPRDRLADDACHKLYLFLHLDAAGAIVPCVQDIDSRHMLGRIDAAADLAAVHRITRAARPDFPMCAGCELKQQDLLDYYAGFLHRRFADRLPALRARLDAVGG